MLLKNSKVMKDKERLRGYHRLKGTKETCKLNSMHDPRLDPEPGK